MKTQAWKTAGLVLALMGAVSVVDARQGECDCTKKRTKKGEQTCSETTQKKRSHNKGSREFNKQQRGGQKGRGGPGQGQRPNREQIMKRFDADGDGHLNERERRAAHEAMKKHFGNREGRGGPEGRGGAEGRKGRGQGKRSDRQVILEQFDVDGDGQLSKAERQAVLEAMKNRRSRGE